MKILNTSLTTQTIKVIPRSYPSQVDLYLRDDSTNEVFSYNIGGTGNWNTINVLWNNATFYWNEITGLEVQNDYLIIPNIYTNLVERRFYDLTIKANNSIIYKDKVFCTDQDINESTNNYYTVNKDEYTVENTYDNDYIIL